MTLYIILHAVISSSKAVIPKTILNPSSTIALPLSSMAVAYASSMPSKSILQQHHREQEHLPKCICDETQLKRLYHGSSTRRSSSHHHQQQQRQLPEIFQASSDRVIDPFLGNLLNGFCNGSCYKTNTR